MLQEGRGVPAAVRGAVPGAAGADDGHGQRRDVPGAGGPRRREAAGQGTGWGGQREGTGHRPEPGGLWFGLGFVCVKEPRRRALNKANSGCKCLKITRPSRVWPSRWVSASVQ